MQTRTLFQATGVWVLIAVLVLSPERVFPAGTNATTGQSAAGGGGTGGAGGSNTGGGPAGTGAPAAGSGGSSLLAESKAAVYRSLAHGMDQLAAELAAEPCSAVVFNLPLSAQDVANVSVLNSVLNAAPATIAALTEDVSKEEKKLDDPVNTARITQSATADSGTASTGIIGTIGSAANSASLVSSALSAVVGQLAQFKNQSANSSGSLSLDVPTVNSLMTIALRKEHIPVYDFTNVVPLRTAMGGTKGLLNAFKMFRGKADELHTQVTRYAQRVSRLVDSQADDIEHIITNATEDAKRRTRQAKLRTRSDHSTGSDDDKKQIKDDDDNADTNEQHDLAVIKPNATALVTAKINRAKALASYYEALDAQYQTQIANLISVPAGGNSPANSTAGAAAGSAPTASSSPAAAVVAPNAGPLAQYLVKEYFMDRLDGLTITGPDAKEFVSGGASARRTGKPWFLTCRLISADATETNVTRYILENYTTSSAITTLEVDAFDLEGECRYAASIENRGTNLYWFSRIKDAAQVSPSLVHLFPWFFRRPRQPQFAVAREQSSVQEGQQIDSVDVVGREQKGMSDHDLMAVIEDMLRGQSQGQASTGFLAKRLGQSMNTISTCLRAHPEVFTLSKGGTRWGLVDRVDGPATVR